MEEIYLMPDGSNVDIAKFSQFEKTSFLLNNPNAKKQKGAASGAAVASKKAQAQKKDTVSPSAGTSSGSLKLRLPSLEESVNAVEKGKTPPPPSTMVSQIIDYKKLYNLHDQTVIPKETTLKTDVKLPGSKKAFKTNVKYDGSEKELDDFVKNFRDNPVTGELGENSKFKIAELKQKQQLLDTELRFPHLYYSSKNQDKQDDFVKKNFKAEELEFLGVNTEDFDGFLNKKGYKADYLNKEAKGLFGDNLLSGMSGYNVGLANELAKKKLLNLYMEDMKRRDFAKQDITQEIEIVSGVRKNKEIVKNELFDTNGMAKYVETNFPILTQKLKDRDAENAKLYKESKKGGTDFFSWDTASKIGAAGWNAIADRTAQVSASVYSTIGMESTAEGVRMLNEENQLLRANDRGIAYVSGRSTKYKGTNYIVDSKGEIYDVDSNLHVTDLFNEKEYNEIKQGAKYGPSDWAFSTQGAAVQTSGVMADMLLQAAVTRGVGGFGAAASGTRAALAGTGKATGFSSLLNDTSQLLRKIPIDRATGYSMIGQGALGYAQGYEDTLKAARDNGINDEQAFRLAAAASQRMAVLYSTTGVINPQTNVVENVFGSKNVIKKAIEQYTKTGEKGFVKYLDNVIKNTPRNIISFAEEGGKEVVQENIQQIGETYGVNAMTNRAAGKNIVNEVMSGDDFMNTSVLSFISSGLISKMKMPSFRRGESNVDDLVSLSTLAKHRKDFTGVIDGLVEQKVFTVEKAAELKKDVEVYANNINKLPKTISAKAAMPIMRELDHVTQLEKKKSGLDKAFHEDIDNQIEVSREKMKRMVWDDEVETKNKAITKAVEQGTVKGLTMQTFSTANNVVATDLMFDYLVDVVGIKPEDADYISRQGGAFLDEETLKQLAVDPSTIKPGTKMILVNEDVGFETKGSSIAQHEFLHALLSETVKGDTESQKLLGKAMYKELRKMGAAEMAKKNPRQTPLPAEYLERLKQYDDAYTKEANAQKADLESKKISREQYNANMEAFSANKWEEALTLYSDALSEGYVAYDEGTFTKLKDVIRRVLQNLGLRDIKFESGRDVYNFVKDYNKAVERGSLGSAIKKLGDKRALIDKVALRSETALKQRAKTQHGSSIAKFALNKDRKSSEQIKKDINKFYDRETWTERINSQRHSTLWDVMSQYDDLIIAKARILGISSKPSYDQSHVDMLGETYISMSPHVKNFNKEFLEKRAEFKKELEAKGLKPDSVEFKSQLAAQDEKGYQGKKGIVKENDDLNGWINSQLANKMWDAVKTGRVVTEKFQKSIDEEGYVEGRGGEGSYDTPGFDMEGDEDSESIFEMEETYSQEQQKLAVLLSDPVFRFVDEKGNPINIETVPFGAAYVTESTDPSVAANRKLKTETDQSKIADLKRQLKDFQRGLDLEKKAELTFAENEELKQLKSFKSYDLSTGMMVNTYEALSVQDTPAKIITDDVGREILRSPNIETLEYRNFKEKLSTLSKTMARRMTFKNGPEIESFMYDNWELLYDIINHPIDPVTGESSYASKKLPPRLKEFDKKGDLKKVEGLDRTKFLQSYYGINDAKRIIQIYSKNPDEEIAKFEEEELNEKTGKTLWNTAYFDRRTALMELFGDVMVLQEARRLLRNDVFLESIKERNVNLYNDLKNDIIRTKVLESMAKGKSAAVKFRLAPKAERSISSIRVKGNPTRSISNNPDFGLENAIANYGSDGIAKFSLADFNKPLNTRSNIIKSLSSVNMTEEEYSKALAEAEKKGFVNKKYLNNYNKELHGDEEWYMKALQLSDVLDGNNGKSKLHTLTSAEAVAEEIEERIQEIRTDTFKSSEENPYIIKEFKEDYIDRMLAKSRDPKQPDQHQYEAYWKSMKESPEFRQKELVATQNIQQGSLYALITTVSDVDAFSYLFLIDALSNRYYVNEDGSITRRPIKKSEYAVTKEPIMDYGDTDVLFDITKKYKDKEGFMLAGAYIAEESILPPINFEDFFVSEVDGNNGLYKFKQGTEDHKVRSLFKMASYSERSGNKNSKWCTGTTRSQAFDHLAGGDFYIIADNETKVPVLAIRYDDGSISEISGTGSNQDIYAEHFDKIQYVIDNLPSDNIDLLTEILETAKRLDSYTEEEIALVKDIDELRSLIIDSDMELNVHLDSKTLEKSSIAKGALSRSIRAGGSKTHISDGINVDENGVSNITNFEDLALVQSAESLNDVTLKLNPTKADDIELMVEYEDMYLENLIAVNNLVVNGLNSFSAPKLEAAETITLSFDTIPEGPMIELNHTVEGDIEVFIHDNHEDGNPVVLFREDTAIEGHLSIRGSNKIVEAIDLLSLEQAEGITIKNIGSKNINLPQEVDKLTLVGVRGEQDGYDTNVNYRLRELEKAVVYGAYEIGNLEVSEFDTIRHLEFSDLSTLDTLKINVTAENRDLPISQLADRRLIDLADNIVLIVKTGNIQEIITVKEEGTTSTAVKFSLAQQNNGKLSSLLRGLSISQQWVVARDIDKALALAKMSAYAETAESDIILDEMKNTKDLARLQVLKDQLNEIQKGFITFNVAASSSNQTDEAIAYFVISKAAQGYNNFIFEDPNEALQPMTKQVLEAIDVKSAAVQRQMEMNSNLENGLNLIIEENKGILHDETFSPETAKNIGKNIGKGELFLPPQDEDFVGLLYKLASARGEKGEAQKKFLTDHLIDPYSKAMLNLMRARQRMYGDWKDLINKKHKGISKVLKKDSGYGGYLNDQAVRVYLWKVAGYDIPGLDRRDLHMLSEVVRTNPELRAFAEDVSLLSKQANGYVEPDHNWGFGSVVGDINNVISKTNRTKFLEHWQSNADKIFSKQNMAKIEAVYGRVYVKALQNMLERMKTGSNRATGSNDTMLNWINGATGVTMFLNARSALLQTISAANFVNTTDNNAISAGARMLNVPQFLEDFWTLWKSDYLKDRRSGLMNDVAEAELAQLMNDPRNNTILEKFKAGNYWLLKQGFGPTRLADSFAIAFGGASFYRNRLNTYKKTMSEDDAKEATMRDFYETSEVSQQSADVSKISMNQASTKGRILLSFLNTPFQYSRIIKKATIDLAKGRGSAANNIAKITYYAFVQNIAFNLMQNALFSLLFDDDDEQEEGKFDSAKVRAINGALDTLLRGSGMTGAIIATVKNAIVKAYEKIDDPKGYGDVILELSNFSPSIGIKLRAIAKAYKAVAFNLDEIIEEGFSIHNTYAIEAFTSLTSAATNTPIDRIYQKFINISDALDDQFAAWQRVFFLLGYNKYNLGYKDEEIGGSSADPRALRVPELSAGELKNPELR